MEKKKGQEGSMHLTYWGHSMFSWEMPSGTQIVIDPFRNPAEGHWFDQEAPGLEADLVLVTHEHFDHDAVKGIRGHPQVLDRAGVVRGAEYVVRGIAGHHARADEYGAENRVFVLEASGVRTCHWGDNDADPDGALLRALGDVDVLMVPVDGSEHILTMAEVAELTARVHPRIVIPMHYLIAGLTAPESTLEPIDDWLDRQSRVRRVPASGVLLDADRLPLERELWVFEACTWPSE
jgi:L-ascorbate metabolism protein UlaG (beta-lactamase superfamily)